MEGSRAAAGQQEQQQGQQARTSSGEAPASSNFQGAAAQQQQHLPPTHKPLTHNPPTSPKSTPWASPATGSPFPQLARPDDSAMGVISSSSGRADRMSPTAAPWVAAPPAAAGPQSSQLMTGRPVQGEQMRAGKSGVGEGCGWGYQSRWCESTCCGRHVV